ncbi:hypothetical protein [Colwellia sp. 75C3]|uniref:hypothetical protein n=1 Tax=Colwellia sp. 75C3 TaxID=888425 RepID=UPI0012FE9469|nr:hypothetical protein [Colwellia sp. 75C3]
MVGTIGFLFIFSLFQQFFPSSAFKLQLFEIIKIIIPRISADPLTAWGRGITSFSPEPAMMVPVLFFLLCVNVVLNELGRLSLISYRCNMAALLVIGVMTKAVTFYFFILVFLLIYGSLTFVKRNSVLGVVKVLVASGVILSIFIVFGDDIAPERIKNIIYSFNLDFSSMFSVINEISGSRIGVNLGPYCRLFDSYYDYSTGFGAWSHNFQYAVSCLPVDINTTSFFDKVGVGENIKPSAYLSLIILDFGYWGLIFILIFIFPIFRYVVEAREYNSQLSIAMMLTGISLIVIGGWPHTIPGFWAGIAILLSKNRQEEFDEKCMVN